MGGYGEEVVLGEEDKMGFMLLKFGFCNLFVRYCMMVGGNCFGWIYFVCVDVVGEWIYGEGGFWEVRV